MLDREWGGGKLGRETVRTEAAAEGTLCLGRIAVARYFPLPIFISSHLQEILGYSLQRAGIVCEETKVQMCKSLERENK